MPGIDGFETVRRVRVISETYIVPVTARTDESDVVLGLSIGADDYITKPFRPAESAPGRCHARRPAWSARRGARPAAAARVRSDESC